MQLAGLETGVPVSFGVLTTDTAEQARERLDKGVEAAGRRSRWPSLSLLRAAAEAQANGRTGKAGTASWSASKRPLARLRRRVQDLLYLR